MQKALTGVDFDNGLVDGFFLDDKNVNSMYIYLQHSFNLHVCPSFCRRWRWVTPGHTCQGANWCSTCCPEKRPGHGCDIILRYSDAYEFVESRSTFTPCPLCVDGASNVVDGMKRLLLLMLSSAAMTTMTMAVV